MWVVVIFDKIYNPHNHHLSPWLLCHNDFLDAAINKGKRVSHAFVSI